MATIAEKVKLSGVGLSRRKRRLFRFIFQPLQPLAPIGLNLGCQKVGIASVKFRIKIVPRNFAEAKSFQNPFSPSPQKFGREDLPLKSISLRIFGE